NEAKRVRKMNEQELVAFLKRRHINAGYIVHIEQKKFTGADFAEATCIADLEFPADFAHSKIPRQRLEALLREVHEACADSASPVNPAIDPNSPNHASTSSAAAAVAVAAAIGAADFFWLKYVEAKKNAPTFTVEVHAGSIIDALQCLQRYLNKSGS